MFHLALAGRGQTFLTSLLGEDAAEILRKYPAAKLNCYECSMTCEIEPQVLAVFEGERVKRIRIMNPALQVEGLNVGDSAELIKAMLGEPDVIGVFSHSPRLSREYVYSRLKIRVLLNHRNVAVEIVVEDYNLEQRMHPPHQTADPENWIVH